MADARDDSAAPRPSAREMWAMLELAADPIFARGQDRLITFWNAAAEELYGYSREQALGRQPQELLQTRYPIPLEEIERRVEQHGRWEGELEQTAKDGRRMTVHSRWGAVYDRTGRTVALLEVNRDITERLQAEAQRERDRLSNRLVHAQRLESLGLLAGGIAHDFNNLLAVVGGYSAAVLRRLERLRDRLGEQEFEALRGDLSQIAEASARAAGLTHQLLAFAAHETVEPAVIDVNATIVETLELLARTLGRHIQLVPALAGGLPHVRIDPGQLGQVLVNLAVNSRQAMPRGGRLEIATGEAVVESEQALSHGVLPPGRYVRIRVADTGSGMGPEVVEHAFDPFFTTRATGDGSGLGLASVYGIVTQAGGQVHIESELGRGTSVTILLPATGEPLTEAEQPVGRGEPQPAPAAPAAATVLVVDDEPALRRVIARTLSEAGYTVLEAGSGPEALELPRPPGARIDLLVTDVVMGEMMGPQLAAELRRASPELKVVFMSGFARPSLVEQGQGLEGRLLVKPFRTRELLDAVAACLTGDG